MISSIDFVLIEQIQNDLLALFTIVQEKMYDKGAVNLKIKSVIQALEKLNTIKDELRSEYKGLIDQWEQNQLASKEAIRKLSDYTDRVSHLMGKLENNEPIEALSEDFKNLQLTEENKEKIRQGFAFDVDLFNRLLAQEIHMNFAKKRKLWLWVTNSFFQSYTLFVTVAKVTASATVGFFVGPLFTLIWPGINGVIAAIVVTLATYFTTDKKIDKYADRKFWQINTHWVHSLFEHFKNYTEQIEYIVKLQLQNPDK